MTSIDNEAAWLDDQADWAAAVAADPFSSLDELGAQGGPVEQQAEPLSSKSATTISGRFEAATHTTADMIDWTPPVALIRNLLSLDSLSVLYGPPGSAKTFTAIDWALHIAGGTWWNGWETNPGPVVYVVAESAAGVGQRIAAWETHHLHPGALADCPVSWLVAAPNLADPNQVEAFVEYCAARRPHLVVFDTLARCTVGAEENSAKDMGRIVDHLDDIRRATGACVLAVHHTGKDTTQGARGSNALRGAASTEIEIAGADELVTLRVRKQKDGPEANPIRLRKTPAGGSLVLVPIRHGQHVDDQTLTAGAAAALDTLRRIEIPGGITAGVWAKTCDGIPERTFYAHRRRLLDLDLVRNTATDNRPRYNTTQRLEQATPDPTDPQ